MVLEEMFVGKGIYEIYYLLSSSTNLKLLKIAC
jgi:hypothetical protein